MVGPMQQFGAWLQERSTALEEGGAPGAILFESAIGDAPLCADSTETSNRGTAMVSIEEMWERARNESLFTLVRNVEVDTPVYEIIAPGWRRNWTRYRGQRHKL